MFCFLCVCKYHCPWAHVYDFEVSQKKVTAKDEEKYEMSYKVNMVSLIHAHLHTLINQSILKLAKKKKKEKKEKKM